MRLVVRLAASMILYILLVASHPICLRLEKTLDDAI